MCERYRPKADGHTSQSRIWHILLATYRQQDFDIKMTAQMADRLMYKGKNQALFTLPLEPYLELGNNRAILADIHRHTACWRGYCAAWTICDDRLLLTGISGYWDPGIGETQAQRFPFQGVELTLQHLFPNAGESIAADWFSGQLRCPTGPLLHRVHMGFASVYEGDLLIEVQHGTVINESVRTNSSPSPQDEEELHIPPFLRRIG